MKNRIVLLDPTDVVLGTSTVSGSKVLKVDVVQTVSGGGGGGDVNLTQVGGVAIALGQTTMSASLPVTIASNQSALAVSATNLDTRDLVFASDKVDASGTVLGAGTNNIGDVDVVSSALPTGAATEAKQDTGNTSLSSIDSKLVSYTEAAAAAANPSGGMLMAVSISSPSAEVTSGQNVALRATTSGRLFVTTEADDRLISLSDSVTLSTSVLPAGSFLMGFKSGTSQWSRLRVEGDNADGIATDSTGHLQVLAHTIAFNGTTWDRVRNGGGTEALALRVTLASDSTGVLSVDDNGSSLTVDGTVTVTQGTAANLNATVVGTGTFAVQATIAAGATTIAKAEDAASANADVGVPAMAVQKATPANTATTDGDYEFLQMSAGRLWTSAVIDTALPAGTNAIGKLAANSGVDIGDVDVLSIIPGTGATNLGKAEDAAHTTGDVGVMALAVRQDTPAAFGADNDYTPVTVDLLNRVHVSHISASKMATPTLTSVAASATSVQILASNTARRQVILVNDSSAICYVKFGTTASTTSYTVQMPAIANSQAAHLVIEEPSLYTGRIDAIWASATGNMRVTEVAS